MLLLCDTLPHVTHLSKCFQISDCDYSIIPRMLASTITSLEQLKTVDGINLERLEEFLEQLASAGVQISKHSNLGEHYFENSIRKPFLCGLIKNIQDRFDDNSVMAAFDVFNPGKLPKLSQQPTTEELTGFAQYGNKEIENLAKQFDNVVDDSLECVEEWASCRQYLKDNYSQRKHRDVISDLCSSTSPASSVYTRT